MSKNVEKLKKSVQSGGRLGEGTGSLHCTRTHVDRVSLGPEKRENMYEKKGEMEEPGKVGHSRILGPDTGTLCI